VASGHEQAAQLLEAFEALPEEEKHIFTVEFLRRTVPFDSGVLEDVETAHAADELFAGLVGRSNYNEPGARHGTDLLAGNHCLWVTTVTASRLRLRISRRGGVFACPSLKESRDSFSICRPRGRACKTPEEGGGLEGARPTETAYDDREDASRRQEQQPMQRTQARPTFDWTVSAQKMRFPK
jgi:hypothetical protein